MFDDLFYNRWRKNRYDSIINHYEEGFFKGKTLLEIGAAWGDFGHMFQKIGAIVTHYEGRQENLDVIKDKYPETPSKLFNCDTEMITDHFDIILHCGVLYHMAEIEPHLKNCLERCDHLILETELQDKDGNEILYLDEPGGGGPAAGLTTLVSRPTSKYIETIFSKYQCSFTAPANPSTINTPPMYYDWIPENKGLVYGYGFRKIWFVNTKEGK